jgi:hypothetical protein
VELMPTPQQQALTAQSLTIAIGHLVGEIDSKDLSPGVGIDRLRRCLPRTLDHTGRCHKPFDAARWPASPNGANVWVR